LQAATSRLVLDLSKLKLVFPENQHSLNQLYLWIGRKTEPTANEAFIRKAIQDIEKAVKLASEQEVAESESNYPELISLLQDATLNSELCVAFSLFDGWLHRLRLIDKVDSLFGPQRAALDRYRFLNEFFCVTRSPTPDDSENPLACVKPVFLREQREILREALGKSQPQRHAATSVRDENIDWIDDYSLNSNSLFAAFPADTRMSVTIPRWAEEKLPAEFDDPQRILFKRLTTEAHKLAAKEIDLAEQEFTTLFSVPVLCNTQPLFTATMILHDSFTSSQRATLASRIRRSGGLFLLHLKAAQLRMQMSQRDEFNRRVNLLSSRSDQLQNSMHLFDISRTVLNPFKTGIDESASGKTNFALPLERARDMFSDLLRIAGWAKSFYERERKTTENSEDLLSLLKIAIASTKYICCECELVPNGNLGHKWMVQCNKDTMITIFSHLINAISISLKPGSHIYIELIRPNDLHRIQVSFRPECSHHSLDETESCLQDSDAMWDKVETHLDLMDAHIVSGPRVGAGQHHTAYIIELPFKRADHLQKKQGMDSKNETVHEG
jgi:hypothetical protein